LLYVGQWLLDSLLSKGNGLSLMRELLTLLNRQSDIRAHPIEAHLPVSIWIWDVILTAVAPWRTKSFRESLIPCWYQVLSDDQTEEFAKSSIWHQAEIPYRCGVQVRNNRKNQKFTPGGAHQCHSTAMTVRLGWKKQ